MLQLRYGHLWQERKAEPRLVRSGNCWTWASYNSQVWNLPRRHSLHPGRPGAMFNEFLDAAPTTTGWISVRASNSPPTAVTSVPCMKAWRGLLAQAPRRQRRWILPLVPSSQIEANRWRDGLSIIRSSTHGITASPANPLRAPINCPSWKSLTIRPL